MDENRIIDKLQVLTDLRIQQLLFESVTKIYIPNSTVKFPLKLNVEKIVLNNDNLGKISNKDQCISDSLMGTLIDYLTRIIIFHRTDAFDFLILDNQLNSVTFKPESAQLLKSLILECKNNMQDVSIDSLSIEEVELIEKLCLFERCFRSGKYGSINAFNFIDEVTLNKIKQMLYRSKHFFDQYGKPAIIDYHCFISEKTPVDSPADYFNKKIEDLHAQIIGDGDYLLKDALVDFKVSNKSRELSEWKKQLWVYYLGLIPEELSEYGVKKENIQWMINFNPRTNEVFKFNISTISAKEKTDLLIGIHHDLEINTTKAKILVDNYLDNLNERDFSTAEQAAFIRDPFKKYKEGIHHISRDEYERFQQNLAHRFGVRCRYKGELYLVKKNRYYIFFLKSNKSLCILHGGARRIVHHNLQYFYDNLQLYVKNLKRAFGPYSQTLQELAREVKQFHGEGRLHGSIVDIDFYDHVYLDPITAELKIYSAPSTTQRKVYPTIPLLLSDHKKDLEGGAISIVWDEENKQIQNYSYEQMLEAYQENEKLGNFTLVNNQYTLQLPTNVNNYLPELSKTDKLTEIKEEQFYDNDMYAKSRIMNMIQPIFNYHTVCIWKDSILTAKPQMQLYDARKIKQLRLEQQEACKKKEKVKELAQIIQKKKDAESNVYELIHDFDKTQYRRTYKGKHVKDVRVKSLLSHAPKLKTEKCNLYIIRKLLESAIKKYTLPGLKNLILNKCFWINLMNSLQCQDTLDNKDVTVLNKSIARIDKLIQKYGIPERIGVIVKNNQEYAIGFIDLQFNDAIVNLDFVNLKGIQAKMLKNIHRCNEVVNAKQLLIYNVAMDNLYFVK